VAALPAPVERPAVDAQDPRGLHLVAVGVLEHLVDVQVLELGERQLALERLAHQLAPRSGRRGRRRLGRERKVVDPDLRALAQRDRALDHVLELARIALPATAPEALERGRCEAQRVSLCVPLEARERQQRDVLGALAQRGDRDRDHVEPIEQVAAEAPRLDLRLQVAVGGGDDAHIDLHRRVAAHRTHLAVLEHAQELPLEPDAHVADLVEEERAAVGLLEQAAFGHVRAGEGASHVAEELALEQALRDRRAVDRDEGPRGARSGEVDRPGDDLLASPALAGDEHRAPAVGDLADQGEDLPHRGARAEQIAERGGLVDRAAQPPVLLLERTALEGLLEHDQQRVLLERLGEVVAGARTHRLDRRVDAAEGGHQHDGGVGPAVADLAEQLDPGAARHADVREHDLAVAVGQPLERLVGGGRRHRVDALVLEEGDDHVAHGGVVVDHQHGVTGPHVRSAESTMRAMREAAGAGLQARSGGGGVRHSGTSVAHRPGLRRETARPSSPRTPLRRGAGLRRNARFRVARPVHRFGP
jgi:hypothetical protein